MSDTIQLNHQVENTYEFDLEIEGLTTVEIRAWFIIMVKGLELSFACTQDNNHFTCKIPPMPFIEKTAYKGAVRLVADDYFFEPVSDLIVNVTGNLSFERTDVKHMTVKSTVGEESKKDAKKDSKPAAKASKKNEGFVIQTDVTRVESSADIAKRVLNEANSQKGIPKSLRETLTFNKNAVIESEVSDFVSDERAERAAKLKEILRNFSVSPESTPTKTKFVRKS